MMVSTAMLASSMISAFYLKHHNHHTSCERDISLLYMFRKPKGGYSSMPPLRSNFTTISTPTSSSSNSIFKRFKRDVYPTVDLPYENNNYTLIDHYFMGMALQQAQYAWDKGEVPIGAIIVRECTDDSNDDSIQSTNSSTTTSRRTFQILSAAHNKVETNIDASSHAELLALRNGAQNLGNWRYPTNSRLYTTLEPCPMCLASIQAFRIDNIIYGAPDNRLGAIKTHMNLISVAKHPYHEIKSIVGGVREEECGDIMVRFFRERRELKKKEKKMMMEVVVKGEDRRRDLLKLPLEKKRMKRSSRFISFMMKKVLRRE